MFFIRRIKRIGSLAPQEPSKITRQLHGSHHFQIPLLKLSANVSSLAIFHLPIALWAVYNTLVADEQKYKQILCVAKTHPHLVQAIDGLLKAALLTRILFDALMGFALDRELRRHMPRWWLCCTCSDEEVSGRKTNTSTSRGMGDGLEVKVDRRTVP